MIRLAIDRMRSVRTVRISRREGLTGSADPDTLILSGRHGLNRDEPWFYVWNGINAEEPSGVGTFRLVR